MLWVSLFKMVMLPRKLVVLFVVSVVVELLFLLSTLLGFNVNLVGYSFSQQVTVINLVRKHLPTSEIYHMKVTFRQSGGYAGLIRGCELDTDSLSPDEAITLQSLVEESGILKVKDGHTPQGRDLLQYKITVETSEGVYHVSFDDMTLPESAAPLIEYLQSHSTPRSPR